MSGYLFLHLKFIFDLNDKIACNLVTRKKGSYRYFSQNVTSRELTFLVLFWIIFKVREGRSNV